MLLKKKKRRKKIKPVGNFRVVSMSGKFKKKKDNIPSSSSFSVLTDLAQQVLAPVGAQLVDKPLESRPIFN